MFFTFGVVKVANSHVCLWTCTDAPWVAQRRSVCSSPALLAAWLFDGSNHCWGSWIAMSDVAWIHVSTWMQASLECKKANESVGHLRWTPWWLPLVVPASLLKLAFARSLSSRHHFLTTLFDSVRSMSWKHWPIRLNSGGPSSMRARKYSVSNPACSSMTCLVIPRWPCCVPSIWHFKRT